MSKNTAVFSREPFWSAENKPDTDHSGVVSPRKKETRGEEESNSGISQNLMLLGRSLHLQTEATEGKLRTEIFDGGRVVATRDGQIDRQAGKRTQRLRIKKFHQKILSGVLERAKRFQESRKQAATAETELPDRHRTDPKVNLEPLAAIDGFVGTCLVDSDSGIMLGAHGGGTKLELAAAGNSQVVRAKRKTMDSLKLNDSVEDILISLNKQYHLIRILESSPAIFLYLVLDRGRANLAMAQIELRSFENSLQLG